MLVSAEADLGRKIRRVGSAGAVPTSTAGAELPLLHRCLPYVYASNDIGAVAVEVTEAPHTHAGQLSSAGVSVVGTPRKERALEQSGSTVCTADQK